jgi:hypothetical protein
MSLLCVETGKDIVFGTPLWAGKQGASDVYFALSQEAIDCIPAAERRSRPCARGESGVDIHAGVSGRNFNGSYTWTEFRAAGFRFSVSETAARKYLPQLVRAAARRQ